VEVDSTSTWEKDHLTTRAGGDPEAIRKAAEMFALAQKPLLLVGGGAHIAEAWDQVKEFVDTLQVPVVTSMPKTPMKSPFSFIKGRGETGSKWWLSPVKVDHDMKTSLPGLWARRILRSVGVRDEYCQLDKHYPHSGTWVKQTEAAPAADGMAYSVLSVAVPSIPTVYPGEEVDAVGGSRGPRLTYRITDSNHVILSGVQAETIAQR
jgi:hypothetical protein